MFSAGNGQHTYQTLRQTASKLTTEFEVVIKRCSEKITEMCKVEKGAWLKLDQLEENCQELITQVERKAESLVSLTILQTFIYLVTLFYSLVSKSRWYMPIDLQVNDVQWCWRILLRNCQSSAMILLSVNLGLVNTDSQKIMDLTLRVRTHLLRFIYYFSNQNIANLDYLI